MQVIVAFAGASAGALERLALPNLARLLARLAAGARCGGDASSLTPPHERAYADAIGLTGADGALALAALAAADDGVATGDAAVGLLTPVHWSVGRDHVVLADPAALQLDEAASREAFDAVRALFESEGYTLRWGAPLRWYALHDELDGLACASIDRVVGRDIAPWLPVDPRARRVRRLQSEVQMLLHAHPLNAAREARGAAPVNSFWLSGCGRAHGALRRADVRVEQALRGPTLAGDAAAWADAWRALDSGPVARLLDEAVAGGDVILTLCGERHAQSWTSSPRGVWKRVAARWSAVDPKPLLEGL